MMKMADTRRCLNIPKMYADNSGMFYCRITQFSISALDLKRVIERMCMRLQQGDLVYTNGSISKPFQKYAYKNSHTHNQRCLELDFHFTYMGWHNVNVNVDVYRLNINRTVYHSFVFVPFMH